MKINMSDRLELLGTIIDVVVDWLNEKGIVIENEEKEQDPDAANIYDEDYFILESRIGDVLVNWDLIPEESECM